MTDQNSPNTETSALSRAVGACVRSACSFDGVLVLLALLLLCSGVWTKDPIEIYKLVAAGLIGYLSKGKEG